MRSGGQMGGPGRLLGADPSNLDGAVFSGDVARRVWRFARPYRWMLLAYVGTIVAQALVQLTPPLLFRGIIDSAIGPAAGSGEGNPALLHLLAGLAVLAALANGGLALADRYWSSRIGEGVIYDLRVALFDHVQRMPVSFFTRTQTGALTSRLNNDVLGAQQALTGTVGSVVSNVITLVTTVVAMAYLEWRLTLLALVVLPSFIVPAKRVGRRLQAIRREQMNLNASMNATMTERFNVAGALLVKLFGRADDESRSFAERADGVRATGVRAAIVGRSFFIALGLVGAIGTAAIYWVGGLQVMDGQLSVGTLVALAAYVTRLYGPLTALTNARVDLMSALVSFERVFEVLDAEVPLVDRPGAVELVAPAGDIEVDDVWFAYPRDAVVPTLELDPAVGLVSGRMADDDDEAPARPVLRGVSAHVSPGELVALVGPSGAGKTTLSMLVPRLYDVSAGAVRVDGHDVRDLTQDSLRAAVGVVTQDPHLFHDTIGNNLRYARPAATDAELMAACRAAQIHHVIAGLPEGYDTVVGDRGYRLSGGEKQRVAIARMLLKDPAVVILDEATSHLDSENEAAIQRALADALAGRTSLVIAHRLSTITAADQILVVEDGRIVERGHHADLLAAGGLYADLYHTLVRDDPGSAPAAEARPA
ncbi:MAG TPA: ABC transporter ATP-binding protein [Acidimicrobiales bacterium]|nr:ABC transporter ATP-binding protein [Acidimicrobiales bacterium]